MYVFNGQRNLHHVFNRPFLELYLVGPYLKNPFIYRLTLYVLHIYYIVHMYRYIIFTIYIYIHVYMFTAVHTRF